MMAMPSSDGKHLRKCHDCGNVATHIANYGPAIACKVCGSCDTRWQQTDEDRRRIALEHLKDLHDAASRWKSSLRSAFPEELAFYTDAVGNRQEVELLLDSIRVTEFRIPCRFENGNTWDHPLQSLTRKVGE